METPREYYTYAYLREDKTPYYIGKGNKRRIYRRDRRVRPPKDQSRIIFLKQNLTEEEAFKHEIYMISVFGRKDLETGILHNRTNGGEGSSGIIVSEETRRKQSEAKKGKYVGKNNHLYGKKGKNHPAYGKRWWNDGKGNAKKTVECPGEGWVLGMSNETGEKIKEAFQGEKHPAYGRKWWNDGCGNTKFDIECPGVGWVLGRGNYKKVS
jgi:hypothetical protein